MRPLTASLSRLVSPAAASRLSGEPNDGAYIQKYHDIDLGLDPIPLQWPHEHPRLALDGSAGGDTGRAYRSAAGADVSILSNVGLPELIARTPEEYVAIAVGLAGDRSGLQCAARGAACSDRSIATGGWTAVCRRHRGRVSGDIGAVVPGLRMTCGRVAPSAPPPHRSEGAEPSGESRRRGAIVQTRKGSTIRNPIIYKVFRSRPDIMAGGSALRGARRTIEREPQSFPSFKRLGSMDDNLIRLGVIGCGGFGLFALQHFTQVPGIRLVGMAGTHRPASLAAAARFGVENVDDVGELLRREDVDVVYIATPPFLHHSQAMAALEAGKHVIVEKPLAMTVARPTS